MRIRENAYIALACLFLPVNNSLAQFRADELPGGTRTLITAAGSGDWELQFLSQPKLQLRSVQPGHTAVFSSFTQCDIFDFKSGQWQTHQFSVSRRGTSVIASGDKAFYAGGAKGTANAPKYVNHIDIYNSGEDAWCTARLSEPREVGGAGTFGNVVIFAGGVNNTGYSSQADIFNTAKYGRRRHTLSQARHKIAVASAGNKIVFAGGVTGDVTRPKSSDAVDIYEVHSDTWRTAKLSESRQDISAAGTGNKMIFAGGLTKSDNLVKPSNTVDIYDAVLNKWKIASLSEAKYGMSVAVAGTKVYFAGGITEGNIISNKVEIYDLETDTWSVTKLPVRRQGMAVGITRSRVMFAGGFIGDMNIPTDRIEVLDLETGTWSVEYLSKARTAIASASCGDKVIFAGGIADQANQVASANIDTWQETAYAQHTAYSPSAVNLVYQTRKKAAREWVYNDPGDESLLIADLWKYETETVMLSILDEHRQTLLSKSILPFGDTKERIDVSGLQRGRYWVLVECNGRKPVLKQVDIKGTGFSVDKPSNILAMSVHAPPQDQLTW